MIRVLVLAIALLGVASPVVAQTGTVNPGPLSWLEPQTNTDATDLTDLDAYRIEVATAVGGPFAAWGPPVKAANANPPAGSRVVIQRSTRPALPDVCMSGSPATPGPCQYFARVVAIDIMGNVGPPSSVVPFALRDSVAPGAASDGRADP